MFSSNSEVPTTETDVMIILGMSTFDTDGNGWFLEDGRSSGMDGCVNHGLNHSIGPPYIIVSFTTDRSIRDPLVVTHYRLCFDMADKHGIAVKP